MNKKNYLSPNLSPLVAILLLMALFLSNQLSAQSVDPLTGRAIINVPLGSISSKDLSMSVALSHNGSALRVDEGPGNAGMGWSLVTAGYVRREVRGLPDEINDTRKGWLVNNSATTVQNFVPAADDNLSVCTDEVADWTFLNGLGYLMDPEPDVYFFSAPGISGKFVYGTDGLPKLFPYQDLVITKTGSGFEIKTNNGITYTFNLTETVTRQAIPFKETTVVDNYRTNYNFYKDPATFVSTWNLSTVQSAITGAVMTLNYGDQEQSEGVQYYSKIAQGSTSQVDTLYYIKDSYMVKQINSINLMSFSINFTWANSLINEISINESETGDSKGFGFVYQSVTTSAYEPLPRKSKPFLMEIVQSSNCNILPAYKFYYPDASIHTVPWRTNWGQDYFGYYNGQNNNRNIPTVYFYQTESGARRYRVTPIPNATPTQILTGVSGSNMSVNSQYNSFGVLTMITYPTGGTTSYTYEPNTYFDATTNEELLGPGVRVASITTAGGDAAFGKPTSSNPIWHTLTKTYQYSAAGSSVTSGRITYPPSFAFTDGVSHIRNQTDLGQGSEVLYGRVKEISAGLGYKEYIYDLTNVYPDATSSATKSKLARPSNATCAIGLFSNGSYQWPFAPLTDWNFKRGYLKKLSEYSESGVLTAEKRMAYTISGGASTIKALRYESIADAQGKNLFYYSLYEIPVNQALLLTQEVTKTIGEESVADSTKSITGYLYNAKNMVTQTTLTNGDGSMVTQNIKYALDYSITNPAVNDMQANAIYKLNTTNRYGEVIETYQTTTHPDGSIVTTDARLSLLKDYGTYVLPFQSKHLDKNTAASFTSSYISGTTSQTFNPSGRYILDAGYEYVNGLLYNQTGNLTSTIPSTAYSSTHYSQISALPLASFSGCKSENAIYDGFETVMIRGLSYVGSPPTYSSGRTGNKSILLSSSFYLTSAAVTLANFTPGKNYYRISAWLYSSSSGNVTVNAMNGSTILNTATLSYTTPNQWAYVETNMDMGAATSTFTWKVSGNNIQLDDFVAIPKTASISFSTIKPFKGITSQSDNRGNSVVIEYDNLGRKVNTYDKNRNLVEHMDYGLQKENPLKLNANFTYSSTILTRGVGVVLTAGNTCIPSVTYQWEFTDATGAITTATGNPVVKAFNMYGAYTVKLTASSPGYGTSSFTDNVCVQINSLVPSLTVSPNAYYHQCSPTSERYKTFTVDLGSFNTTGMTVQYAWSVTDANGNWISVPNASGNTVSNFESPQYNYQMRCQVMALGTLNNPNFCSSYTQATNITNTIGITFYPETQCQ